MDNEFYARAVTVGLEPGFLVKKNDRIYMRKNQEWQLFDKAEVAATTENSKDIAAGSQGRVYRISSEHKIYL